MPLPSSSTRRSFLKTGLATTAALILARKLSAQPAGFRFNYLVASSLYGSLPLREVLPEVRKHGSAVIDLWPRKHGTQREEADELGQAKLTELLATHGVRVAATTRYDLGALKLSDEFKFLGSVGAKLVVTGGSGPTGLSGNELKSAVRAFATSLQPTLDEAARRGMTVAIENHGNNLVESPDSIRWLAEFTKGQPLAIALAPYHLPQEPALIAGLIRELGDRLAVFYAWQYGMGCMKPMPRAEEHLQLPGRGSLDFVPLVQALRDIKFTGWTEVFMHPTPRGIAIMDTAPEVTVELNRGRDYLEACLAKTRA